MYNLMDTKEFKQPLGQLIERLAREHCFKARLRQMAGFDGPTMAAVYRGEAPLTLMERTLVATLAYSQQPQANIDEVEARELLDDCSRLMLSCVRTRNNKEGAYVRADFLLKL